MTERLNMFANQLGARIGKRFAGTAMLIEQALPKVVVELVNLRVSQINGCGYCTDAHAKELAHAGQSAARVNLVATWRESTVFTEAERAVLALAEEGTRLADAATGVSDETWAEVRKHFDEDQVVALVSQIGMINAANRFGVILRTPGGSYEPGAFAAIAD
ncbi:carboxymuconolactone decarboxylase family protein [Nonomuraea sp. MG754425]|uniref:carboxymuconolactone decarboxylase family protein n=1 Tax=Nonomuraea sp. MG754425 TaxID=2570319 RepID=UPI001F3B8C7A|nr:carboxymuconolactone decarboxylase family protein [Nonomuraea sp. MG754425]MCF6467677.1 carboxymuconolactone decarboxylase family protein [Nonomuraea sp. MG754425]